LLYGRIDLTVAVGGKDLPYIREKAGDKGVASRENGKQVCIIL